MQDMKFVAILNKRRDLSELTSALGHVVAGVTNTVENEAGSFVTYIDADGEEYPHISEWSLIVLRASPGQLKATRTKLEALGLPAVCYLNTMCSGGSSAQQLTTKKTHSDEIEILAIATFGTSEKVDSICKKFSLWR